MPNTRSPIYNSHHEFFNLQLPDVLTIQVSGTVTPWPLMFVLLLGGIGKQH
jgi:hypothetical protein